MVEPLRDLMDRQIFTEAEVKAIVSRRRESEYLLRRRAARKADFLRYIEAEMNLEKLRSLRSIKRKRELKRQQEEQELQTGQGRKDNDDVRKREDVRHVGDSHIIQHLHLLFVRAIRKFRSDLSLHLQHAEFCKEQKSWKRLGRVYAEALQVFPRQDGLWIESASQEFFGPSRSIRNARIMLQRGLRINGTTSQELWLEYFSLELHYAQTLKGRRQILLGDTQLSGSGTIDGSDVTDENGEYHIAMIVYKNAIKNIPDSVPFRLKFLDTCRRFPNTQSIMDTIESSLEKDFEKAPEAWIARALYAAEKYKDKSNGDDTQLTRIEQAAAKERDEGNDHDEEDADDKNKNSNCDESGRPAKRTKTKMLDPVTAILEEAVEKNPNDEMYLQALRFAKSYTMELDGEHTDRMTHVENFIDRITRLHGDSPDCSVDFLLELVDYMLSRDLRKDAINIIGDYCTTRRPGVVKAAAWIRWAALLGDVDKALKVLRKAIDSIPSSDRDHLLILLQMFGGLMFSTRKDEKEIASTFERILLLAPGSSLEVPDAIDDLAFGLGSVADACSRYLEYSTETGGLKGARRVYEAVLFHSSQKLEANNIEALRAFIDKSLQMEIEARDRIRVRRLYDKAVDLFQDTPLEEFYRKGRLESWHF